jgi:hypothetical protein
VNGRVPLLGVADVPRTPCVDAGAVEAAGDVAAAGADDAAGVAFFDECCAPWTPLLVDGVVREMLLLFVAELFVTELLVVVLLVVELFTTVLFVVLLLVTLVFVVELLDVVLLVDGVDGVEVEVEPHVPSALKCFTACQSRMCRLGGHATLCGWLLPGP